MVERYFHVMLYPWTGKEAEEKRGELEVMLNDGGIKVLAGITIIPVVSVMADTEEKIRCVENLKTLGYVVEEYGSNSLKIQQ